MPTSRFDPKQYVMDFERAWADRDMAPMIQKYYDANVEFNDPTGKPQRGTDALKQVAESWFNAFSEMTITLTQSVQSGNEHALLQRFRGRHTGELEMAPGERIPATNKPAEIEVAEFIRVNDAGKIVRDAVVLDTGQLLMQLGLLPSPGQQATMGRAVQR